MWALVTLIALGLGCVQYSPSCASCCSFSSVFELFLQFDGDITPGHHVFSWIEFTCENRSRMMFPTSGLFQEFSCPFYSEGQCDRPYCHFSHCKRKSPLDGVMVIYFWSYFGTNLQGLLFVVLDFDAILSVCYTSRSISWIKYTVCYLLEATWLLRLISASKPCLAVISFHQ